MQSTCNKNKLQKERKRDPLGKSVTTLVSEEKSSLVQGRITTMPCRGQKNGPFGHGGPGSRSSWGPRGRKHGWDVITLISLTLSWLCCWCYWWLVERLRFQTSNQRPPILWFGLSLSLFVDSYCYVFKGKGGDYELEAPPLVSASPFTKVCVWLQYSPPLSPRDTHSPHSGPCYLAVPLSANSTSMKSRSSVSPTKLPFFPVSLLLSPLRLCAVIILCEVWSRSRRSRSALDLNE